MSRTCEPVSLALQIVQAILMQVDRTSAPHEREQIARREFERYTAGLYDFERQQVLINVKAELHGAI